MISDNPLRVLKVVANLMGEAGRNGNSWETVTLSQYSCLGSEELSVEVVGSCRLQRLRNATRRHQLRSSR